MPCVYRWGGITGTSRHIYAYISPGSKDEGSGPTFVPWPQLELIMRAVWYTSAAADSRKRNHLGFSLHKARVGGRQSLQFYPVRVALSTRGARHGARSGPKCAPYITGGAPACPKTESSQKYSKQTCRAIAQPLVRMNEAGQTSAAAASAVRNFPTTNIYPFT